MAKKPHGPAIKVRVREDGVLAEAVELGFGIKVFPPSATDDARARLAGRAGGYHRIVWRDATGKRHTTTAGATFDDARRKAESIAAVIESGADKAGAKVSELIAEYLKPGLIKVGRSRPRSAKTLDGYDRLIKRFITPVIGHMRCGELNPAALKAVLDAQHPRRGSSTKQPLSHDDRERVRGALTRIIKFGAGNGYITQDASLLIQSMATNITVDASQARKATEQGFHIDHISPDAVPSAEAVAALAGHMQRDDEDPWWYELMVYLAAYSGLRIGELLGLEKGDVEAKAQYPEGGLKRRIRVQRQVNVIEGRPVVTLPKGDKVRTTVYPERTPTTSLYENGYPLEQQLRKRLAELAAPTDRLFPSPSGGEWWRSNLYRRLINPAARKAGWYPAGSDEPTWTWHSLRHVYCTYMLWDRNKSPRAVADAAGHSSVSVTLNLYGGAGVHERLDTLD
jgi:integrase